MKATLHSALTAAAILIAALALPQLSNAQITNPIVANISHPFTIANATFPAGKYYFRMISGTDLMAMSMSSADNRISDEFLVRQSRDATTPAHSELVFERYGNQEFLSKIYEAGTPWGAAVEEPSRQELRLQKQGQHAVEHTEGQTS